MDKIEKFDQMEQELAQYHDQENNVFQMTALQNQIDQLNTELETQQDMTQQIQIQCNQKDQEIRDLDNQIEDLKQQLENQSYDIFYRVREEMANELEAKNFSQILENGQYQEMSSQIDGYMEKYT